MMTSEQYTAQRDMSTNLFKNGLVVPAASAILAVAEEGETFTAKDLREQLGGRVESNQIRDLLEMRFETSGAVAQLPYLGRPNARVWERLESPLWPFIENWVRLKTA